MAYIEHLYDEKGRCCSLSGLISDASREFEKKLKDDVNNTLSPASSQTRTAVRLYLDTRIGWFLNELLEHIHPIIKHYETLLNNQRELEDEIAALEKKREYLVGKSEEYTDKRFADAELLFNQITSKKFYKSVEERMRRLTAAGAIVSAALGMKYYNAGYNTQDDETYTEQEGNI